VRLRSSSPLRRVGLLAAIAFALVSPVRAAAPPIVWPTVRLVDGTRLAPQHWQGRATVVVFWATWCGFCERHNQRIEKLYRSLSGRDPRILAVSIDGDDASVRRLARGRGWTFPVAVDDGALRAPFTTRRLVPMTCIVDTQGAVRQCIPGEMSEPDVMVLARLSGP
jgi:thiol-disulfide isomerase/thioredoxin